MTEEIKSYLNYINWYETAIIETKNMSPVLMISMLQELQTCRKLFKEICLNSSEKQLHNILVNEYVQYANFIKKLSLKKDISDAVFDSFIVNLINNYKSIKLIDNSQIALKETIYCLAEIKKETEKLNGSSKRYRINIVNNMLHYLYVNNNNINNRC